MYGKSKVIFKGVTKRDSGVFVNDEGKSIQYKDAYVLTVDALNEKNQMYEKRFKFPLENEKLYRDLLTLDCYTEIYINYVVKTSSIMPISIELLEEN